jgi:hypothetical protein
MYKFLFLFFMLGAAAVVYKSLERTYLSQTVIARVTLTTNCELDPKAFAIKNINSGEVREFQHGEAFIKATLADKLMVVLSEKFNKVYFDGEVVTVKRKVEIFQDCRKSAGIDGIFKSFNEQFAAK